MQIRDVVVDDLSRNLRPQGCIGKRKQCEQESVV